MAQIRLFLAGQGSALLLRLPTVLLALTAGHALAGGSNPAAFGDVSPIMGWVGPPGGEQTLARYREMAEAGLTVSLHHPADKVDLARDAGLLAILSDGRIEHALQQADPAEVRQTLAGLSPEFGANPTVVGFGLRDEPTASYFPNLARVSRQLLADMPGRFPYINLLPNYANSQQLGTDTYEAHVRTFIEMVSPPVISFDHYPPVGTGWRANYYENFEIVRRVTLEAKLPFWAFCLTTPHGGYRDPTEAEIRLQVYSDLVYGAKGLCYFCYWTPGPSATWDWDSAIIRVDGVHTEHFEQVKRVNARVREMGKVLLKCTSTEVYHTGDLPQATRGLPAASPVRCIANLPLIFGFFAHDDGSEYVMVVNRDYAHNVRSKLQLKGIARLHEVAPLEWIWSGDGRPDDKGMLPFRLLAGDARLFRIERR